MRFFLLAIVLCVFYPLISWSGDCVVSRGVAFVENGMEIKGRQKAIDDALQKALRKWMRNYYHKENHQCLLYKSYENKIIHNPLQYAKNVVILDEQKSCFGTIDVNIKAEIDSKSIIENFPNLSSDIQLPIGLMISSDIQKQYLPVAKKMLALLIERLKHAGFSPFVPKEQPYMVEADGRFLISLVIDLFHDIKDSEYQGLKISSNEIRLTVDIVRMRDKTLLDSVIYTRTIPDENCFKAFNRGANLCMNAMWKELKPKLLANY